VDNRTQVTDDKGLLPVFAYDGLKRLLTMTCDYGSAKASTVTEAYNALRLVREKEKERKVVASHRVPY
jgi:hypothetical protein